VVGSGGRSLTGKLGGHDGSPYVAETVGESGQADREWDWERGGGGGKLGWGVGERVVGNAHEGRRIVTSHRKGGWVGRNRLKKQ